MEAVMIEKEVRTKNVLKKEKRQKTLAVEISEKTLRTNLHIIYLHTSGLLSVMQRCSTRKCCYGVIKR